MNYKDPSKPNHYLTLWCSRAQSGHLFNLLHHYLPFFSFLNPTRTNNRSTRSWKQEVCVSVIEKITVWKRAEGQSETLRGLEGKGMWCLELGAVTAQGCDLHVGAYSLDLPCIHGPPPKKSPLLGAFRPASTPHLCLQGRSAVNFQRWCGSRPSASSPSIAASNRSSMSR